MSAAPVVLRPPAGRRDRPVGGAAAWLFGAALGATILGALVGAMPLMAAGLIGGAVATAAFVSRPLGVLLAILATRPALESSSELIAAGGTSLIGVMDIALALAGGAALVLVRPRIAGGPARVVFALVLALGAFSLAWSIAAPVDRLRAWVALSAPFVAFGLAAWTVRDVRAFRRVLTVVLASATIPVVAAAVQFATGNTLNKEGYESVSGTFNHPNGLGLFMLLVIPLGLVAFLETRDRRRRRLLAALGALAAFAMLNSYARVAWLGLALILGLLAVVHYRQLIVPGVVALGLAVILAPGLVTNITARFADLSGAQAAQKNSVDWRQQTWGRMLPYAEDRPLQGHGLGSYLPLSNGEFGIYDYLWQDGENANWASLPVYAHNDYLYTAIELGVPGAVLWVLVWLSLTWALWRAARSPQLRPYAIVLAAVALAVAFASISDNVKSYPSVIYAVMALSGAALGAAQGRRSPAA